MPSVAASANDQALYSQVTNGGSQSRNKLAQDLNTFLTLLTSQLKYQDPLSPMDSTEFTNQLVQFSQVEQQITQNEKLTSLLQATQSSQAAMAVNYMGRVVEVESNKLPLQDGSAKFAYGLAADAETVGIMIQDSTGKTVYGAEGKTTQGVHEFNWDGKDDSGNQLEDGTYTISVTAMGEDGSIDTWTTVFGTVTGVTSQGDEVLLIMDKVGAPMSKLLSVTEKVAGADPTDPTDPDEGDTGDPGDAGGTGDGSGDTPTDDTTTT